MTMTCNRPFGHLPHETTQGACDGLLHPDRDTRCPHPGCDHHAATPDRAHALPVGLVDHLTLLGSDHGPALVLEATAALWPTLAAAGESAAYDRGMLDASTALATAVVDQDEPVIAWRGGAHHVRDSEGHVWNLHIDNLWRSETTPGAHALTNLADAWGPLTVVVPRG